MIQLKEEHKDLTPIKLALLTWYLPNNPLYKNPEHPTVKLAGEIGELLDLYAKHKYKPNFDWMKCKHCGELKDWHSKTNCYCHPWDKQQIHYTPMVIDELGDIWYYLRILAWMLNTGLPTERSVAHNQFSLSVSETIKYMYWHANNLLEEKNIISPIYEIMYSLYWMLEELDYIIEDLTLINYQKLVLDSTNHGWKDAR